MADKHPVEDLRAGSDVFASDGTKLGRLYAIVLDPASDRVTHVAVDAGPHFPEPGFGAPTVRSVEIDRVLSADGDSVNLDIDEDAFAALPLYEHEHFFEIPKAEQQPAEEGERPSRLWGIGQALAAALANIGGIAVPAEHFAKATSERHILDDAPVWRDDPNTHIGDVERVLVDDETDTIVGLVIKRGVLFHEEVVLPMQYVREIRDGAIIVQLTDAELEGLAPFTG
jgi:sporulation protein YlmC with PRC-barrel domain